MSRKDYIMVASIIREIPDRETRLSVTDRAVQHFRAHNPRFDPDRFRSFVEKK